MEIKDILQKLHPLERKVLPHLAAFRTAAELIAKSGLSEVEVVRALQWLANKEVLVLEKKVIESVVLDHLGKTYVEQGLPEERMLVALADGHVHLQEEVLKAASLSPEEFSISLGLLKKKAALILAKKENKLSLQLTDAGKKIVGKSSLEKQFLLKLHQQNLVHAHLTPEEKFAVDALLQRKNIIALSSEKSFVYTITELGKKLAQQKTTETQFVERLTPELLRSGAWKKKTFRAYDVEINVPHISGGKRHFVKQAMRYAKKVWMDMGFKEMTGTLVQTSFWNFDALFTPQDHPGRDLQDSYFLKKPAKGSLPTHFVNEVRASHEHGGTTGSKGWNYQWDEENAKKNVLRSHTTVLSAHTLAQLRDADLPAKYFALGRCFRNEAIDWSHLCEFNQTEGIVIDPDANFCHLLGYLKTFFAKMGFPQARFRPAHFPYTEPSVEIDVFHPVHKKWIEFGGAGIFRPEVVVPLLGRDVPVLAWGPGFDRIILDFYHITDIRDLYRNDVKQLREMRLWNK